MRFIKLTAFYLTYQIMTWVLFVLLRTLPLWIFTQLGWSFSLPSIITIPIGAGVAYFSLYLLFLYLNFKFGLESPFATRWTALGFIVFFAFFIFFLALPVGFLFLLEFIFGAQEFGDFLQKNLSSVITWFFFSMMISATQLPLCVLKAYHIME